MFKVITIGDVPVEMKATGSTVIRYKQIFHRDYFRDINDSDIADRIDVFTRMGFVMAKQAEGADMGKLNEDSFIDWLDQFDPLDVESATDQIMLFFAGSEKQSVNPKKETEV